VATVSGQIGSTTEPIVFGSDTNITFADAEKLRALVVSLLTKADHVSLYAAISKAYRLGNESCHKAMAADQCSQRPKSLSEVEREAIEHAYNVYDGDVTKTASVLGIGRTTTYRKLREYGIVAPSYERCPNCGCNLRTYRVRKS
jgi:DNA-binding NtrC family response regulator